jgi:hypothetical protein
VVAGDPGAAHGPVELAQCLASGGDLPGGQPALVGGAQRGGEPGAQGRDAVGAWRVGGGEAVVERLDRRPLGGGAADAGERLGGVAYRLGERPLGLAEAGQVGRGGGGVEGGPAHADVRRAAPVAFGHQPDASVGQHGYRGLPGVDGVAVEGRRPREAEGVTGDGQGQAHLAQAGHPEVREVPAQRDLAVCADISFAATFTALLIGPPAGACGADELRAGDALEPVGRLVQADVPEQPGVAPRDESRRDR